MKETEWLMVLVLSGLGAFVSLTVVVVLQELALRRLEDHLRQLDAKLAEYLELDNR